MRLPQTMQVITDLNLFIKPKNAIITQGTFDGVHAGHRQILGSIVQLAREQNGKSILVTFHPHPRQVLYTDENSIRLLTTLEEKIELFSAIGLDYLVILPFDETLSKMPGVNFVRDVLVDKIGVTTMVVGHDHRFGRNREASFDDLKEFAEIYGFEVREIAAHDIREAVVSSTKIRTSLLKGDILTANLFLERDYSMSGKVVHGKNLGKGIGYPTANLEVKDKDKLIPANGIYAVRVKHHNKMYGGMLSIGNNPTIEEAAWSIEVNIFNFNKAIYGDELTLFFTEKMRDEVKFESLNDLKIQLKKDEISAKGILKKYEIEEGR
ncbi:MAG: bifunctional riboflavin kinase/FAD synthetase [Bacteroidia bacterium]